MPTVAQATQANQALVDAYNADKNKMAATNAAKNSVTATPTTTATPVTTATTPATPAVATLQANPFTATRTQPMEIPEAKATALQALADKRHAVGPPKPPVIPAGKAAALKAATAKRGIKFKQGGSVGSASKRGDGIAQRGKTKGRMV